MNAIETYLAVLAALATWSEWTRWRNRREARRRERYLLAKAEEAVQLFERELGKPERRERVQ